jgi:hypothetical protein
MQTEEYESPVRPSPYPVFSIPNSEMQDAKFIKEMHDSNPILLELESRQVNIAISTPFDVEHETAGQRDLIILEEEAQQSNTNNAYVDPAFESRQANIAISMPFDVEHETAGQRDLIILEEEAQQSNTNNAYVDPAFESRQANIAMPNLLSLEPTEDAPLKRATSSSKILSDHGFTPDAYCPPQEAFFTEEPKSVKYDDWATLASRLHLPELFETGLKVSVQQVSTMDVVEAEHFGISRDAYFKLKRYFISKRKYT